MLLNVNPDGFLPTIFNVYNLDVSWEFNCHIYDTETKAYLACFDALLSITSSSRQL